MVVNFSQSAGVEASSDPAPEPVNILLVDDEVNNLKALEAVLAADDRNLMWAESGEDALRWLLKERFAVVLLDVHMPGMDGFETAALMRQHVRLQSTPIIFLTAANKEYSHVSRGYTLGAVDYIFKPLDVHILRSKVAVFVDLFRKSEQVRRQAEQLTEARGFLESVLESTTDYAIIVQDIDGLVLAWYEGARQLYSYSAEEMVGKQNIWTLFAPEDVDSARTREFFLVALRHGRAEGEFEQVRRDGGRFTASVNVNLRRDADGDAIGYVLIVKDVTEQRLKEERERLLIREQAARTEAEAANRRFALLAEASTELTRLLDSDSALQTVASLATRDLADACMIDLVTGNGRVVRHGLAHRDTAKEPRLHVLTPPESFDHAGEQSILSRVLGLGEPVLLPEIGARDVQEIAPGADQRRAFRAFHFTSAMVVPIPIRDAPLGALWLLRTGDVHYGRPDLDFAVDLARRIGVALDNARLYHEAQEAIQMREEFLSVASHELKTPVTSMRGYIQLMIRRFRTGNEPDPARLERAFQVLDDQSAKLSRLVSQLLDVSRLQAGKLVLEPCDTDITALIASVVARAESATPNRKIELRAEAGIDARVDPLRLEQVVTNLVDNALKYSPEKGRIEVEASRLPDGVVVIAVRDWGQGIPPEHRDHIFDRFHQASEQNFASGMGLGLYISREIVELHGGEITAEFPKDGGSRFVVTLPSARTTAVLNEEAHTVDGVMSSQSGVAQPASEPENESYSDDPRSARG